MVHVISQVDTLLRAVRGYYLRTGSVEGTEFFIKGLGIDNTFVENV